MHSVYVVTFIFNQYTCICYLGIKPVILLLEPGYFLASFTIHIVSK